MSRWVKCETKQRAEIWINLDEAATLVWNEKSKATRIVFAGEETTVDVVDRPEDILKKRTQ